MGVWRKRIAFWIAKAKNTHSEYVIFIAFPLQQLLHERPSMLRCTHIASVVMLCNSVSVGEKNNEMYARQMATWNV
jgi:hypothetical protein